MYARSAEKTNGYASPSYESATYEHGMARAMWQACNEPKGENDETPDLHPAVPFLRNGRLARAAEARVAALNDEEVALLASQFDELPAGGRG